MNIEVFLATRRQFDTSSTVNAAFYLSDSRSKISGDAACDPIKG
jgi:hypothetical protein